MRRSIRSIKRQMLALFLGLIILIMGLIFALNSGFLEQYYVSNKLTEMTDMYQLIDDLLESDKLDNEAALNSIWRKAGRNNLSINGSEFGAVYGAGRKRTVIYTSVRLYHRRKSETRKHAGIVGYVRGIQTETGFRQ